MNIAGHQVDEAMFNYIAHNIDADTVKLLLKNEPLLTFDKSFAILQIECRRKTNHKIPELLEDQHFLFPRAISAEQCTHQVVAQFHATQFSNTDRVLDMTMGLGIDAYYIAQRASHVTTIELDPEIANVGKYNYGRLCAGLNIVEGDSVEFLNNLSQDDSFDAIFIDPARRDNHGKRVYGLADCCPDVLTLLPTIERHAKCLYIKASPMLDVTQSVRELGSALSDVWAISVGNECKELFFNLDFEAETNSVNLHALNYDGGQWHKFTTSLTHKPTSASEKLPQPGMFLYEPNASIMKLGCHSDVQHHYGLSAIANSSHLYINTVPVNDFPGRHFVITQVIPFKSKEIKRFASQHQQINVATRNFRLSADQLKQRLNVQDGGNLYLFATTLASGDQVLLLCKKS